MTELTVTIPGVEWMSSNDREHRHVVRRKTAAVRERAGWLAREAHLPTFDRVHVCAFIQYPTARKADPPNAWPTVKACIDGMVDAGVFPDDSSDYVVATEFRRDPGKSPAGTYRVRIVLTDQSVPFAGADDDWDDGMWCAHGGHVDPTPNCPWCAEVAS